MFHSHIERSGFHVLENHHHVTLNEPKQREVGQTERDIIREPASNKLNSEVDRFARKEDAETARGIPILPSLFYGQFQ